MIYDITVKRYIQHIIVLLLVVGLWGCGSRKNNTAQTRMYHAFFAKYNTFYNGSVAFDKARKAQIKGHKDNYLSTLPMLIVSNKNTQGIGGNEYKTAIEKSQKAIKNHSIKRKPRRERGAKLTEKKKQFYAQKEFNPFLWRAWLMMADSYFKKGEFTEAAGTYIYIARLYENNPKVLAAARIGLAQCYNEMDWLYEAEELLSRTRRDSMPASLEKDLSRATANLLIKQERYADALPHMSKAVKRKGAEPLERAREYYLMGQLNQLLGNKDEAFKCYEKVISKNPPYELEINARIRQTETVTGANNKKIVRKLERMIRSSKNQDYLAQLHYALGNVHLNSGDTVKAIETYETGVAKGEASGYGAGMLRLSLANVYWEQRKFTKSYNNYQAALANIDKENKEYDTYNHRTQVLSEVSPHADIIETNTELLHWATLDEAALAPLIEKKIEQAKFEEKLRKLVEKKERKDAQGSELEQANTMANMNMGMNNANEKAQWYFYNRQLVAQGIRAFSRTWGDRKLKDFWRLSRENIVTAPTDTLAGDSVMAADGDSIAGDSLMLADSLMLGDTLLADSLALAGEAADSIVLETDPTKREYWTQQIPTDEERKSYMHKQLSDALFQAAKIFEERLGHKELAMHHWERLVTEYPEYEKLHEAFYHLFLCSSRWGETEKAELYKNMLLTQFPDSSLTIKIQDPDFFLSVATKRHKEDSLYVDTYAKYLAAQYDSVISNNIYASEKYPDGAHRSRFMFVDALAKLYSGRQDEALSALSTLLSTYSQGEIAEIAKEIDTGVKEGRLLHSGITTSIWERRSDGTIKGATDTVPPFNVNRAEPHYFVLAFPNDSLDEKRLLFEMARYNFARYMVRHFTMEFNRLAHVTLFQVQEFLTFDEAFLYRKRLYGNGEMAKLLEGINSFIISKSNLDLLLKYYTFEDYSLFYRDNLQNIPELEIDGFTLDEPQYIDDEESTTPEPTQ